MHPLPSENELLWLIFMTESPDMPDRDSEDATKLLSIAVLLLINIPTSLTPLNPEPYASSAERENE